MMSLMVFTISAVSACQGKEKGRCSMTALPALVLHLPPGVQYLDLLVYGELLMVDVLHLHHQDVGVGQRLKLGTQVSF